MTTAEGYIPPEDKISNNPEKEAIWKDLKRLTDDVRHMEEFEKQGNTVADGFMYPVSYKLAKYLIRVNMDYCHIQSRAGKGNVMFEA